MGPNLDAQYRCDVPGDVTTPSMCLSAPGWIDDQRVARRSMAALLGCAAREVIATDTDVANATPVISEFYCAVPPRRGVLVEWTSRESVTDAAGTVLRSHGYDAARFLARVHPRCGENALRSGDLADFLVRYGHEYSTVIFAVGLDVCADLSEISEIVAISHGAGCMVGLDLTQVVAVAPLALSDWNPDFALWHTDHGLGSCSSNEIGVYVNKRHLPSDSIENRWLHSTRPHWIQSGFRAHLENIASTGLGTAGAGPTGAPELG